MKVTSLPRRPVMAAVWMLTLLLAAWAYWPGLSGPLLLDDFENLNTLARIEQAAEFWVDIVWANSSGPTGRPLSMLSFALEKRYLDQAIVGQKSWGLFLHLLNGCLVFALLAVIFRAAGAVYYMPVAQLSASIWLMSPLLLSTTLYVVQRMTLLSATFSLLALILYCVARQRQISGRLSAPWLGLALLATVLAFFSKENGVLALPMMAALELFVFRWRAASATTQALLRITYGSALAAVVVVLVAILVLRAELLFAGYAERDFTLWQRLLTQSRILWSYLWQFFWPNVHALGVYHDDIVISTGLAEPRRTLVAVLAWLMVVAGLVISWLVGRWRLPALGLSLFLIGHAMESTLLPLELYFEHRNYLPSVGLVVVLGWATSQLYHRCGAARSWLVLLLLALLARHTLLLGSQAVIWSDSTLLHLEAANGHPHSPRANYQLAQLLAQRGSLAEALELAQKAGDLESLDALQRALIAAIYYCWAGASLPLDHWDGMTVRASVVSGRGFSNHFSDMVTLVVNQECAGIDASVLAADFHALFFRADHSTATPRMLASLVFLENHLQKYPQALEYADLLNKRLPDSVLALQFQLYLSTILNLPEKRAVALERLMARREAGKLTRQEVYNLELFRP